MAVMFLSFLLGMMVAFAIYLLWRFHAVAPQHQGLFTAAALTICPPYILSFVVGSAPDSDLELVLAVGTIVFANGFLYAGVASGGYFLYQVMTKKNAQHS